MSAKVISCLQTFASTFALMLASTSTLFAQGTLEDYNRAYSLHKIYNYDKVKNTISDTRWHDSDVLHYRLNGADYTVKLMPDGEMLPIEPKSVLPPAHHERQGWKPRQHRFAFGKRQPKERHWMEVDDEKDGNPVFSPDSQWVAYIQNDNVWVARPDGKEAHALSLDGTKAAYFSSYIQWSPDGRYVCANRIIPVEKRYVHFVESSPDTQLQPILHSMEYAKPGDALRQKTPYIFEVQTGRILQPDDALFRNQYELTGPVWRQDSKGIFFDYNGRGHKVYRVLEMSAETGKVRTIIEETAETYVRYSNYYQRTLKDDARMLWLSDRDNWPHLYLYDVARAKVIRQVTKGAWCVREVVHVDEEKGVIYFTANGVNPDEDPYFIHYYRIGFDGKNLVDLTPAAGNHRAQFSPDYAWIVDTYSTVDTPPVTEVRNVNDVTKYHELARADISELKAAGWIAPEVFVAPGRDGVTPMWGIIQRPSNFNPNRKYPIIEYIYSGPGDSYTPKNFSPYMSALAELGFIVVQLDAMGTSNRGKKFEEVCYKNLKDAGFPDRILWIKAAAAKYPYMDIDRVGIYGCSAGGQESTAAVLFHGDFYKAAYSACGCHDNRMDKIWWNEQWMSYPVDSSYVACSNVENAWRLERPLMLVVGELDDNVDPASTMQVAAALIKANKPFELVVIPGAHHTMGESYGEHKRYDFFVKHLLGVDPPAWSEVK